MLAEDVQALKAWAEDLAGVFTMADLKVLFAKRSEAALYKKLQGFVGAKCLVKIKRGLYATPNASLEAISHRINPDAYISTGTILARHAVIGSIPEQRLQAIKVGRPRVYRSDLGMIEHLSIQPSLFFGFELRSGIKYATPEKAYLDAWYFAFKGKKFSFDLDQDVNMKALNTARLSEYLKNYDRHFVTYFDKLRAIQ